MEENQIIQNEGVESEVVAIPTDNDTTAEVTTEPIEATDTAEPSKDYHAGGHHFKDSC